MTPAEGRQRLRDLVASIDYKPGWTFDVPEPATIRAFHQELPVLHVTGMVPSIYAPHDPVKVSRSTMIPCNPWDARRTLDMVRHAIVELELHEVDEWLTYDGDHVRDPHPDTPDHQPPTRTTARNPR